MSDIAMPTMWITQNDPLASGAGYVGPVGRLIVHVDGSGVPHLHVKTDDSDNNAWDVIGAVPGPQGPQGDPGPTGATGATGPAGPTADTVSSVATSNVSVSSAGTVVRVDPTSAGFNVTLPAAMGLGGRVITIKNVSHSANAITVLPTGGDTIDGDASQALSGDRFFCGFQSDGVSDWMITRA